MNRRNFLKSSVLASGGLLISTVLPINANSEDASKEGNTKNALQKVGSVLAIHPDNTVTVYVYKQEMGQGISTGIAQIAAEELDAHWDNVSVHLIDYDKSAKGYLEQWGRYDTGGSFSMEQEWGTTREAAAAARLMLIEAATRVWDCAAEDCQTVQGFVIHKNKKLKLSYGELASLASSLPIPKVTNYKAKENYQILGKPKPSLKNRKVVTGELTYSIDEEVPGMVYTVMVRPPVLGGTVKAFDDKAAKKVKGVQDIFELAPIKRHELFDRGIRGGIVVTGNSTWSCLKASKLLTITWDNGENEKRDDTDVARELENRVNDEGRIVYQAGNGKEGIKNGKRIVKHTYKSPYLAHGLMEPLNSISDFSDGENLEVWAGTQSPQHSSYNLARALEIPQENIVIHPYHMGGGYGRRYCVDFIFESAVISKKIKKPVKLTWTREDEIQFGAYHPIKHDVYTCDLDKKGNIESVEISAVSAHVWSGGEVPFVYGYKNIHINSLHYDTKFVEYGAWRAVVAHHDTFAREIFIDEVAHEVGEDPLNYRIQQLKRPTPTTYTKIANNSLVETMPLLKRLYIKVLEDVAELSQWDKPRGKNTGLGVAVSAYHNRSLCAHVAEVEMTTDGFRVTKIFTVADCGLAVNPNLFEAQVQSSINWGLTSVLKGGIDIKKGAVQQSNFHDMPLVRMHESPEMHIKIINSEDRSPSGVGEFAVTPVAPAISNAIFRVSGKRHRFMKMT